MVVYAHSSTGTHPGEQWLADFVSAALRPSSGGLRRFNPQVRLPTHCPATRSQTHTHTYTCTHTH